MLCRVFERRDRFRCAKLSQRGGCCRSERGGSPWRPPLAVVQRTLEAVHRTVGAVKGIAGWARPSVAAWRCWRTTSVTPRAVRRKTLTIRPGLPRLCCNAAVTSSTSDGGCSPCHRSSGGGGGVPSAICAPEVACAIGAALNDFERSAIGARTRPTSAGSNSGRDTSVACGRVPSMRPASTLVIGTRPPRVFWTSTIGLAAGACGAASAARGAPLRRRGRAGDALVRRGRGQLDPCRSRRDLHRPGHAGVVVTLVRDRALAAKHGRVRLTAGHHAAVERTAADGVGKRAAVLPDHGVADPGVHRTRGERVAAHGHGDGLRSGCRCTPTTAATAGCRAATTAGAANAGILAAQIVGNGNSAVRAALKTYRERQRDLVLAQTLA